jgi:hypothetical protein
MRLCGEIKLFRSYSVLIRLAAYTVYTLGNRCGNRLPQPIASCIHGITWACHWQWRCVYEKLNLSSVEVPRALCRQTTLMARKISLSKSRQVTCKLAEAVAMDTGECVNQNSSAVRTAVTWAKELWSLYFALKLRLLSRRKRTWWMIDMMSCFTVVCIDVVSSGRNQRDYWIIKNQFIISPSEIVGNLLAATDLISVFRRVTQFTNEPTSLRPWTMLQPPVKWHWGSVACCD